MRSVREINHTPPCVAELRMRGAVSPLPHTYVWLEATLLFLFLISYVINLKYFRYGVRGTKYKEKVRRICAFLYLCNFLALSEIDF